MRTLIYGMQSSGASLFCYWLGQQSDCISIIDLYFDQIAPPIDYTNVIVKCVVTKNITLEEHIDSFKPDKIILFVRNPIQNYLSLSEKKYSNWGGTINEKFSILDQTKKFDIMVKYEDFIMQKNLGIGKNEYYEFKKSLNTIVNYNCINNDWCRENYKKTWSIGNIHANNLSVLNLNLCPVLSQTY